MITPDRFHVTFKMLKRQMFGRAGFHLLRIEGDYMGQIHPAPANDPHRTSISERNIAAT
ncbi:hypothetical protein ACF1BU_03975 [Streptomyces sp. NPDC014724]|uniref:hypothetical protein n=1 Tax=unclassified Streptomyces TaxID=2593676 RepID=UPI0036FC9871